MSLVVVSFWPGYISSDSIDQLNQARSGIFNSAHPPLMAGLWSVLDRIVPGPGGLLLWQNLAYWCGLCTLAFVALRRAAGALVALVIGLSPGAVALLSTAWKDTQLGVTLALAVSLLALLERRFSWALLALIGILLMYANSVRGNAPPAVLPIALWAGWHAARQLPQLLRAWTRPVGALAFFGAVHLAGAGVSALLVDGRTGPPYQASKLHDLVGISLERGLDLLPDYVEQGPGGVSLSAIKGQYVVDNLDPLFFTPGNSIRHTGDPAELAALQHAWWSAVTTYPGAFVHKRWVMFSRLVGMDGDVQYPYHWQVDPNPLGVTFSPSKLNALAMSVLNATRNSVLFRAWFFLVIATMVLAIAVWRRRIRLSTCVALSSLLYAAPYFLVAPVPSYRYIWWCIIAGLLLPLLVLAERRTPEVKSS